MGCAGCAWNGDSVFVPLVGNGLAAAVDGGKHCSDTECAAGTTGGLNGYIAGQGTVVIAGIAACKGEQHRQQRGGESEEHKRLCFLFHKKLLLDEMRPKKAALSR
jgi:hypothetical protein